MQETYPKISDYNKTLLGIHTNVFNFTGHTFVCRIVYIMSYIGESTIRKANIGFLYHRFGGIKFFP